MASSATGLDAATTPDAKAGTSPIGPSTIPPNTKLLDKYSKNSAGLAKARFSPTFAKCFEFHAEIACQSMWSMSAAQPSDGLDESPCHRRGPHPWPSFSPDGIVAQVPDA